MTKSKQPQSRSNFDETDVLYLLKLCLRYCIEHGVGPGWAKSVKSVSADSDHKDGELILSMNDGTDFIIRSRNVEISKE